MGAVCQRYSYRRPVRYFDGCFLSIFIQAFELLKAIAVDAKGDKRKVGRIDIFSFRLGIRHLLHETFCREMIGGAAGQEQ